MRLILCSIIYLMILASCNESNYTTIRQERKLPANMVYDYECVTQSSTTNKVTDYLSQADEYLNAVVTTDIEVSDKEQNEFGEQFLRESKKEKSFKIDELDPLSEKLNLVLTNLLRVRENPSLIKYDIYLLKDTSTVNAYTVGGKIFITTAIVSMCKNDDQLYAIIGHEIGHNEKGHIKASLKQLKASNKYFGTEWGGTFLSVKKILTGSFNQKNEVESDYYGLDLTWKLGLDVCAIKSFWDQMATDENHDLMRDFFSTHPYSDTRSSCLVNHIKTNFKQNCQ